MLPQNINNLHYSNPQQATGQSGHPMQNLLSNPVLQQLAQMAGVQPAAPLQMHSHGQEGAQLQNLLLQAQALQQNAALQAGALLPQHTPVQPASSSALVQPAELPIQPLTTSPTEPEAEPDSSPAKPFSPPIVSSKDPRWRNELSELPELQVPFGEEARSWLLSLENHCLVTICKVKNMTLGGNKNALVERIVSGVSRGGKAGNKDRSAEDIWWPISVKKDVILLYGWLQKVKHETASLKRSVALECEAAAANSNAASADIQQATEASDKVAAKQVQLHEDRLAELLDVSIRNYFPDRASLKVFASKQDLNNAMTDALIKMYDEMLKKDPNARLQDGTVLKSLVEDRLPTVRKSTKKIARILTKLKDKWRATVTAFLPKKQPQTGQAGGGDPVPKAVLDRARPQWEHPSVSEEGKPQLQAFTGELFDLWHVKVHQVLSLTHADQKQTETTPDSFFGCDGRDMLTGEGGSVSELPQTSDPTTYPGLDATENEDFAAEVTSPERARPPDLEVAGHSMSIAGLTPVTVSPPSPRVVDRAEHNPALQQQLAAAETVTAGSPCAAAAASGSRLEIAGTSTQSATMPRRGATMSMNGSEPPRAVLPRQFPPKPPTPPGAVDLNSRVPARQRSVSPSPLDSRRSSIAASDSGLTGTQDAGQPAQKKHMSGKSRSAQSAQQVINNVTNKLDHLGAQAAQIGQAGQADQAHMYGAITQVAQAMAFRAQQHPQQDVTKLLFDMEERRSQREADERKEKRQHEEKMSQLEILKQMYADADTSAQERAAIRKRLLGQLDFSTSDAA